MLLQGNRLGPGGPAAGFGEASFLQNGGTNASVQQFCPNDSSSSAT
jgi:hypothetical protein